MQHAERQDDIEKAGLWRRQGRHLEFMLREALAAGVYVLSTDVIATVLHVRQVVEYVGRTATDIEHTVAWFGLDIVLGQHLTCSLRAQKAQRQVVNGGTRED